MITKELNDNKAFRAHFCERVGIGVSEFVAATAGGEVLSEPQLVALGDGYGKTDVKLGDHPEETTANYATWTVGGLISNGPITSMGVFYLKRVADAATVEE